MYGVRAATPAVRLFTIPSPDVAEWGVDYVKADDMSAFKAEEDVGADPSRLKEIAALGRALKK